MPPEQCPDCGRFLKKALVDGLADGPASCPGCATDLDASMFGASSGESVRPPDLEPADVRDDPAEALAGWDRGGEVVDLEQWREDRPPFPVDAAVLGGAAAAGALVGALATRRRPQGAVLGALAGATVAAVARRVWRLEE